jgi:hypothetical protein
MKISWIGGILFVLASTGLLAAQQPIAPTAGMEIDLPEVVAEVKGVYDAYIRH